MTMPVLKLNTQPAAQGAIAPKPAAVVPSTTTSSKNPTAAQPQAGSSSGCSGPEPAAPVPEPLSPQFRPISTTPIPPPTIPSFASGRQTFTHREHPPQVESVPQPPPPEPIDFRDNVDVIALESAILLLQRQKRQAEEDIRHLRRIKEEAIAKPSDFVRDLTTGRVGGGGGGQQAATGGAEDDDEDSDDEREDGNGGEASDNGLKPSPMEVPSSGKGKAAAGSSSSAAAASEPSWSTLPKPQDVVRMPAINWSKYAVVGESLDKLHSEQLARPTLGTPGAVGANGTYEFKAGPNPDDGKWVGVSAPYDPLKDKLKPKAAKRGG